VNEVKCVQNYYAIYILSCLVAEKYVAVALFEVAAVILELV
jgi:hypothetical protein